MVVPHVQGQAGTTSLKPPMIWVGVRSKTLSQLAAVGKIHARKDMGKL